MKESVNHNLKQSHSTVVLRLSSHDPMTMPMVVYGLAGQSCRVTEIREVWPTSDADDSMLPILANAEGNLQIIRADCAEQAWYATATKLRESG